MSNSLHFIFLLSFLLSITSGTPTSHFTLSNFIFPDADIKMELDIYTPTTPSKYPVIVFLSGFEGLVPGYFYDQMLTKLAENNVISVTLSKVELVVPSWVESNLELALNWIQSNLTKAFAARNDTQNVTPEVDKIYLMSHSAGAHATTLYLNKSCGNVKGMIYLDPVDGIDPFGIIKIYVTDPPKMLPFDVPTLIVATGFDDQSYLLTPPCAPANTSNERFYGVLKGPTWYLNFTEYGHADCLDDFWMSFAKVICRTCEKNCDYDKYRTNMALGLSKFVEGLHWKNESAFDYFEKPETWTNITVQTHFKLLGFDKKAGGYCKHDSEKEIFFQK